MLEEDDARERSREPAEADEAAQVRGVEHRRGRAGEHADEDEKRRRDLAAAKQHAQKVLLLVHREPEEVALMSRAADLKEMGMAVWWVEG